MDVNQRYVLKPKFGKLSEYSLQLKDILIYTTIKSFFNTQDQYCYPSYAAIAKRSGTSVHIVSKSVKRLEAAGLMDIWTVGKFHVRHYYRFDEKYALQKIPFTLLTAEDLSTNEKCMLLMLADFGDSSLDLEHAIEVVSENSRLVKKTVASHFKSLSLKGYLTIQILEDPLEQSVTRYLRFTKLKWSLNYDSSTTSLKADDVEPQSWGMSVVEMATRIFKNAGKQ
jgi:hypothetical protein